MTAATCSTCTYTQSDEISQVRARLSAVTITIPPCHIYAMRPYTVQSHMISEEQCLQVLRGLLDEGTETLGAAPALKVVERNDTVPSRGILRSRGYPVSILPINS